MLNYITLSGVEQSKSTFHHCSLLIEQSGLHRANNPTMFFILETSSNELQLSILEAFLITQYQPELSTQKQFYTLILFSNPLGP